MVGWIDDDLGLAGQASERSGVHDSVPVAFETGALVVGLLCDRSLPRSFGKGSTGSERRTLALLPKLATHDGPWSGLGLRARVGAYQVTVAVAAEDAADLSAASLTGAIALALVNPR